MRLVLMLPLLLLLAACTTVEVDDEGKPLDRKLSEDLVLDTDGRIVARPTRLIAPHTVIINGGTPTEREIRLLGVEGLPEKEAPATFARCQEWMRKYLAEEQELFVKPALDSDLGAGVIYGIVYVQARDEETGQVIAGGYVNANMAMLSEGLVRIRDAKEFQDERLRARMKDVEAEAKREKRGLWGEAK
ncbi:MAG: thermonuclease family protein [Planctomycetes bacterium]|nr:thermonuclease family protein [Planctomycetota bacterium]